MSKQDKRQLILAILDRIQGLEWINSAPVIRSVQCPEVAQGLHDETRATLTLLRELLATLRREVAA